MSGMRLTGARTDIHQCIVASLSCQAACEAAMEQLATKGMRADSGPMRLLRQCAELCELNVRALRKDSRLARRTVSLCLELSTQVTRAAWLNEGLVANVVARSASQLARACHPLLFA
jgi:hypothetical protein